MYSGLQQKKVIGTLAFSRESLFHSISGKISSVLVNLGRMEFPVFFSIFYLSIILAFISQIVAKMTQDVEMKEEQQQPAPSDSVSPASPTTLERKSLVYTLLIDDFEGIRLILKNFSWILV